MKANRKHNERNLLTDDDIKQASIKAYETGKMVFLNDGGFLYFRCNSKGSVLITVERQLNLVNKKENIGYYPFTSLEESRQKRDELMEKWEKESTPIEPAAEQNELYLLLEPIALEKNVSVEELAKNVLMDFATNYKKADVLSPQEPIQIPLAVDSKPTIREVFKSIFSL